ncbi:hypothetical protein Ahy_A03g012300 isoform A [Arachis hypogaea]|uniref:F-box domain-containing protein n=2 Tax=Arachis hypogaea TaxID=3818 RepID=A0A445DT02_ARAHY|nr:hypothetical protein Ahy_A03g012300 isoform A [Arachis hypogaea]
MENQFPDFLAAMGEQILPDDLLMEIFTRTDPKTAARCRTASTTWRVRLSSERFRMDNTLTNIGKYRNVLLQIGDPERYGSTQAFCIVDCEGGERVAAPMPEQLGPGGWWNVIGSDCGVICVQYSTNGPDLRLLLWNPLLRTARQLDDPADKLLKQAVIGYAFGYRAGTDNYCVVHMSKRHVLDRFLHCNVFNSAEGSWKHAYINDQRLTHLDEGSAFHLGKAVWVNWGGRGLTIATHVVVLDADTFILSKIRINRNLIQHVQALRVLDGIPHLVGYERSPHRGLSTIWCKIDLESMCLVPFIRRRVAGQYGVPWNPMTIMVDRMITVRENNHRRARDANGGFLTEISLVQINLLNRHRVTAFNGEWPSDMNLQRVITVGVGCLVP